MTLALKLWGLLSLVELCIYIPGVWRIRRYLAGLLIVGLGIVSGALVAVSFSTATVVLSVIALYRIFNLLRLVEGRMQPQSLARKALRTSGALMGTQVVALIAWKLLEHTSISGRIWLMVLAIAGLLASLIFLLTTRRQLQKTLPTTETANYADRDLPSITVCVPARNETPALQTCLGSLVVSDYPKLEILVLDDCSQDKSSDIIRSFAHEGVRFIKGVESPESWLAKNWAYQQLYKESSGELIVFCGVDIGLAPGSLRQMVITMLEKKKEMISIIPKNQSPSSARRDQSTLIQPMRYAWELCLPRRLFNRPPVLGSCWIIDRKFLKKSGSFAAFERSVTPESYLAKAAIVQDQYSFVRSTDSLVVTSTKEFRDQWETAVRTRYPQLHRRPELVLLVTLIETACLLAPIALVVLGIWQQYWILAIVAALSIACSLRVYVQLVSLTYRRFLLRSLLALPFAVLLDIVIRHDSMWQYEFSEVIWKGRNVCLPVMQVSAHLPPLPPKQ